MDTRVTSPTYGLLEALPKTDLHCHLDGSLRVESILELAEQDRVDLPAGDPEGLRRVLHAGQSVASLERYLEAFSVTLAVLQTERGLHRAAFELVEDAARENVRYLEVRFSPVLHTGRQLALTAVLEAVSAGLRDAERKHRIKTGIIVCGIRTLSPDVSRELAELAAQQRRLGVVGFDLAGAEADHPARHHAEAFQVARSHFLPCTVHAGEAAGAESIREAIHALGASRIGHGCRLADDDGLFQYVDDHRIALECCPSSNLQTGAVASLAEHPLLMFLERGLRVTVNTDNRLISNTTVTNELWLLHREAGLDIEQIGRIILNGFKAGFMPRAEKRELLREAVAEIARAQSVAGGSLTA